MLANRVRTPQPQFCLECCGDIPSVPSRARWTQERAEAATSIAQEQGFPHWRAQGAILRGWAELVQQGQAQEGISHSTRVDKPIVPQEQDTTPYFLALLADAHGT